MCESLELDGSSEGVNKGDRKGEIGVKQFLAVGESS